MSKQTNFLSLQVNAVLTIAARDLTKLIRDRTRILFSFIFPVIFIGALGGGLQASFKGIVHYDFLTFTFVGVFAQTLFQSTAQGIISLIEDRENDFSQEIFVSPISRYTIIFGKILGETLVSYIQVIGIIAFGLIIGVHMNLAQLFSILTAGLIVALYGGAFGTLVLANLGSQRSANQVFPFIIFPQFFLSGIFTPIKDWNGILMILSRISPMTYAVDFVRSIFYLGKPEYQEVVLFNPLIDLIIIVLLFTVMLFAGTYQFVRSERNK